MTWQKDGHPSQVEALQGTVENLTQTIIKMELAEMYRKQAEAEAAKPKPEPFELRNAREWADKELLHFGEDYRQWAWDEHFKIPLVKPMPLAAGWPKDVSPLTFVRGKCRVNADGTALLGDDDPGPVVETAPAPSFMDQWRK